MMAELASGISLSDRCTVCYKEPKYRCPRCGARSCSAACVKVHKERAMCSGVRDPARYLKKNDLETPEAFDHDFNFISGIERSMEGATRISENMLPTSSIQGTSKNQKKGVVPLQNALKRNNVLVLRAPTGMTRQKQNQTAWNYNKKCIRWTVEWMLDDSSKVLGHSLGIRTMSETYSSHLQEARRNELKEDDGERQGGDDEERKPAEDQEETGKDKEDQEEPKVISKKRKKKPKASHSGTEDNTSVDTSSLQYYLYLPVLSTAQRRVFMHLNATTILDDALQGQGVEEFPTIRVSISGPDELKEQGYTISKFVKPAAEHSLDTAPIRPLSSEG